MTVDLRKINTTNEAELTWLVSAVREPFAR